jgi:transcriptional regulator with XRE-family HTH domain
MRSRINISDHFSAKVGSSDCLPPLVMCCQDREFSAKVWQHGGMVGKEPETGSTGKTVAQNVQRLRGDMSYTQLSRRLEERANWSINAVGIRRIEAGERRVTADDLVALAVALGVTPPTLLMPDVDQIDEEVHITGNPPLSAARAWMWLGANLPISGDEAWAEFIVRAWPRWRVRELLDASIEQKTVDLDGNPQYAQFGFFGVRVPKSGAEDGSDGDD